MRAFTPPPTELRNFFRTGRTVRYQKGEIIMRAGERPEGVFLIERGYVKVYTISRRGEEYVHLVFKPGEVFPLMWVVKNVLYDSFYEALDDVSLKRVPKDKFLSFIRGSQEASQSVLEQIAGQLDVHINRLDNLEYKQAGERVAYRLLTLSKRFGRKYKGRVIINGPFTHQLIAESINLSRESVSREIKKLQNDGLIEYHEHKIVINDLDKMTSRFN